MSFTQRNFANLVLAVIALVALAGIARAGEVKYPPYPDLWGRVLSVPEGSAPTMGSIDTYHNPDGDRLIQFGYDNPFSSDGPDWRIRFTFTFFGGQLRQINTKEANRLFRAYLDTGHLYKRVYADKISFRNGDVLSRGNREFGGKRCWSNYSNTLIKKDSAGRVVLNKMLFSYSDTPTLVEIWESCDIAGEKDHYFASINSTYPDLVPLEDETFLEVVPHSWTVWQRS